MVGDDADGDILLLVFLIMHAGGSLHRLEDVVDRIHLKEVVHPLHHAGQALQAHAGVDVGALQAGIGALAVESNWLNTRFQTSM